MKITFEQARADLAAIRDLVKHPGWAVLCATHEKGVEQLTASALDVNASDETANRVRHARAVVLTLSPQAIADGLESKLLHRVKKATDETKETLP